MNIFVFGSNLDGIHGAGSARAAYLHHGAVMGVGEGITGNSYALPTKGHEFSQMTLRDVEVSVDRFIQFAAVNPKMQFQVTRVGCGLAGFKDSEIAPLFVHAPRNCSFDSAWEKFLPKNFIFWGTF